MPEVCNYRRYNRVPYQHLSSQSLRCHCVDIVYFLKHSTNLRGENRVQENGAAWHECCFRKSPICGSACNPSYWNNADIGWILLMNPMLPELCWTSVSFDALSCLSSVDIWTEWYSVFLHLQGFSLRMTPSDLVKISTVVWEGTVWSAEWLAKPSAPAWTFANGTTSLCVPLMESSMKTTVKCTEPLAWKSRSSPLFTMKTASLKVGESCSGSAGLPQSFPILNWRLSFQTITLSQKMFKKKPDLIMPVSSTVWKFTWTEFWILICTYGNKAGQTMTQNLI